MSYILEALRKADAERERGAVPDLHAQLLPLTAGSSSADAGGRPLVLWGGVALAVAALGLALWWFVGARPDVAQALAAASAPAITLPASVASLPSLHSVLAKRRRRATSSGRRARSTATNL
jgi:general secretion pathway protein B